MIELYYWPTPNGHKITIFLEETGLEYELRPVDIGRGDQFHPGFLKISPNNRMPAIVDPDPPGGGAPLSVFESGAILQYLAEKTGRFLPEDLRARWETLQWLNWQMGNLGPMLGQNHHFSRYAPFRIRYALERYLRETARLYRVLDRRLSDREYIAGDYSIADMACHPWIKPYQSQGQKLEDFPALKAWFDRVSERPAVGRAYALAKQFKQPEEITAEMARNLFGRVDMGPAD